MKEKNLILTCFVVIILMLAVMVGEISINKMNTKRLSLQIDVLNQEITLLTEKLYVKEQNVNIARMAMFVLHEDGTISSE